MGIIAIIILILLVIYFAPDFSSMSTKTMIAAGAMVGAVILLEKYS
jgi:hypothetical protein